MLDLQVHEKEKHTLHIFRAIEIFVHRVQMIAVLQLRHVALLSHFIEISVKARDIGMRPWHFAFQLENTGSNRAVEFGKNIAERVRF